MFFYDNLEQYVQRERMKLERLYQANIPEHGVILQVLGPNENQDKKTNLAEYSLTREVPELALDYLGILGDRHRTPARKRTGREKTIYSGNEVIRQHRHLFAVSPWDCEELSIMLDVEVTPAMLGANIVIGREDNSDYSLSALPVGTHMLIAPADAVEAPKPPIATLVRYVQQQGCGVTGHTIAQCHGNNDLTRKFVDVSHTNRGIVCQIEYPVESPALLKAGQKIFFKFSQGTCP